MKTLRRLFAVILTVAVALTALSVTVSADSIEDTAIEMQSGETYSKKMLTGYNDGHYGTYADYKIVCSKSGTISVDITSKTKFTILEMYDSNFNEVEVSGYTVSTGETSGPSGLHIGSTDFIGRTYAVYYWNSTAEKSVSTTAWNVDKGTYYLRICNDLDTNYGYKGTEGMITVTATFPQDTTATTSPAATDGSILSTIKSMLVYFTVDIPKGSTLQLGAITPNLSVPISWTSHNTNVATITADGKVTAKAKGSAYIAIRFGPNVRIVQVNVV